MGPVLVFASFKPNNIVYPLVRAFIGSERIADATAGKNIKLLDINPNVNNEEKFHLPCRENTENVGGIEKSSCFVAVHVKAYFLFMPFFHFDKKLFNQSDTLKPYQTSHYLFSYFS